MNWKRAILCGALLWVLIFFEVSILMFGFKLSASSVNYYILHYILTGILALIVAFVYFRGKVKGGFAKGLLVGIIFAIIGVILDAIITIPLFMNFNYSFFADIYLWMGILEGIIITGIIGAFKK
ncbi:MAG: hypothetical protein PHF67_00085 [Candidatus Nanoarchaeia archaeon]|nr:hypothetical protein [Candidatus Nanoarchaeia archaeon]